jgi:hypothetical protein
LDGLLVVALFLLVTFKLLVVVVVRMVRVAVAVALVDF